MPTPIPDSMKMRPPKPRPSRAADPLENKPTTKSFMVVSYDIGDDKRRTKVMKAMEDYGKRVQYSVFECNLTQAQLEKLQKRLQPQVKQPEDSIRFYFLSTDNLARTQIMGKGGVTRDQAFYMQ